MPPFGPISRRDLIEALKRAGFSGPHSGGRHQFMMRGKLHLILPNPHRRDISRGFLNRILKQASITRDEWETL
jgi:predicted RNA binding protein YcfA (HicA-like mRNA interferase family)